MTAAGFKFAAATQEEADRRRFGLWAAGTLVLLLPLWWFWGADVMAAVLKPVVGVLTLVFGLTGRIDVTPAGDWSVGTRLTQDGAPIAYTVSVGILRRLLLTVPLFAAFMIAPPRPRRLLRAAAIALGVFSVVFALSVVAVVWGGLAPALAPDLASPSLVITLRPDQPALQPALAQIAIVGRYMALSVVPLLTALILWGTLNPVAWRTLVPEVRD